MRHRVDTKHWGRDTLHRKSLLRNLVREVVTHGSIVTTRSKAKEVRRLVDRLIYKAQTDTVSNRRQMHSVLGKRDVVNTLVERIAPLFPDRVSGFTRIKPAGVRRGDSSVMVSLSLIKQPEITGTLKSGKVYEEVHTSSKKVAKADKPKADKKEVAKAAPKKAAAKVAKPKAKKAVSAKTSTKKTETKASKTTKK